MWSLIWVILSALIAVAFMVMCVLAFCNSPIAARILIGKADSYKRTIFKQKEYLQYIGKWFMFFSFYYIAFIALNFFINGQNENLSNFVMNINAFVLLYTPLGLCLTSCFTLANSKKKFRINPDTPDMLNAWGGYNQWKEPSDEQMKMYNKSFFAVVGMFSFVPLIMMVLLLIFY